MGNDDWLFTKADLRRVLEAERRKIGDTAEQVGVSEVLRRRAAFLDVRRLNRLPPEERDQAIDAFVRQLNGEEEVGEEPARLEPISEGFRLRRPREEHSV